MCEGGGKGEDLKGIEQVMLIYGEQMSVLNPTTQIHINGCRGCLTLPPCTMSTSIHGL